MKGFKLICLMIISFAASAFLGVAINAATGCPTPIATLALFVGGIAKAIISPAKSGHAYMAVAVELWCDYIIENLFKDNEFMQHCFNESDSVLNGAVVHIPQAGAKPAIVKNRTQGVPATIVQRADTDITYALDVYTSDPTLITAAESKEISYDKMNSVLSEHVQSMGDTIADNVLYAWRPTVAGNIVRTTGAAVPSHLPSATGNRKKFVKEDLKAARKVMDKQNISKTDRFALIDADMFDQLMDDADLIKRDGVNGGEVNLKDGVITQLYGFKILVRSSVLVYDDAGTPVPKAVGAAGAATDNSAILCWQKNCVAKAVGATDFFENLRNPELYGDIYSILQKMGGRKRRTGGEGVVAIVQAATA